MCHIFSCLSTSGRPPSAGQRASPIAPHRLPSATASARPRVSLSPRTVTRAQMDSPGQTLSKALLHSLPGVAKQRDPATRDFVLQQTMLRVRDLQASLDFYTRVLGLTVLSKLDFADMRFSLVFLGYADPKDVPEDPADRIQWTFSQPGTLELTHNWGTESDPEFRGYANGNADPCRGFGHIGIAVPDVAAACKRFEEEGIEFVKRPDDGKMKGLAFIKDPDGYWIEVLNPEHSRGLTNWQGNAQA